MLRDTLRRNKGITLIALVVTIIVLLILAGISIAMLTGQNGILNSAAEAKEKTRVAQEDESQKLQGYEDTINQYAPSSNGGSTGGGAEGGNPAGGSLPTGKGTTPYLPNNTFSKKEEDLAKGLVIKDNNDNEYVWVEVPTTIYDNTTYNNNGANKPENADEWEKIRDCLKAYTVDYSNSSSKDTNTDGTTYSDDYKNMLKSVYKNGGFWIGRYEAGYEIDESKGETIRDYLTDSDTDFDTEHPITQKVVIKKNEYPYNWVNRDQAQTLAEGMNYTGVTSSLIYGLQWDLVLKFIETKGAATNADLTSNSKAIGNCRDNLWNITNVNAKYSTNNGNTFNVCPQQKTESKDVLLTTGADESFSLMNIYDIAGNVYEWTLEFANASLPCVFRGGGYDVDGLGAPAKTHINHSTSHCSVDIGFRVGLWK